MLTGNPALLAQRDRRPALGEEPGRGGADHSGADHDDIDRLRKRVRERYRRRLRNHRHGRNSRPAGVA